MVDSNFKILLTDVNTRKGFDVVNIMNRLYKYNCVLTAEKDYNFQLPIIFLQKVYTLRFESFDLFEKDLLFIQNKFRNITLVYMPVSEKPTKLLYSYIRKHPDSNIKFFLPTEVKFDIARDKILFQSFCENNNLPIPQSYTLSELQLMKNNFPSIVVKPKLGQGSVGIKYLSDFEQLAELHDIDLNEYVIQKRVSKSMNVVGAFFLCKDGETISAYTHKRLRTFPAEGGVTVYSESGNDESIISLGVEILLKLNWNGLAMLEFLYEEDSGKWKVLELNPRIWGSVMLSAFNNSNMLNNYVLLAMQKKIVSANDLKSVFIRWYFPFEILNFFKKQISFRQLFTFNTSITSYINFTYSTFYRSVLYLIYFSINSSSIKRFISKLNS